MKFLISLLAMMTTASLAFADADYDPDKLKTPAGGTAMRDGTGSAPNSNINQGSQEGKQSQSGGSGANAAAGAALMAAGAALMSNPPTVPPGAALMAMGLLAMMQSGHDGDAANQSGNTGIQSQMRGANPDAATGTSNFTNPEIKKGIAQLSAAGYEFSEKGLKNPDGSFTPASSFNSAAGMAAAGMTPAAIADAQRIIADAQNGMRVTSVPVASGGGSGSGGVTEGDSHGDAGSPGFGSNPFALNADAKNKIVAGKTVLFDGEPIGVRGQNIFEMIHTCYQKKREGNHFIEGETGVGLRSPASVGKAPVRK